MLRTVHTHRFVLLCCLAFVIVADMLFFRNPWGVNTAVFGAALWLVLVLRGGGALRKSGVGKAAVGIAAITLLLLVEEPTVLAVGVCATALGAVAILSSGGARGMGERVSLWAGEYVRLVLGSWLQPLWDNVTIARWLRRHPPKGRRIARLAEGIAWWFFPLVLGAVFIGLFAIANPMMERWVRSAMNQVWSLFDLWSYLQADRLGLWFLVGLGVYGVLRYRRQRRVRPMTAIPVPAPARVHWYDADGMIIRCLIVFNGVFALETILDIVYLFGGRKLPPGMDYRDYAHRGAYPLIFTALLAGAFVLTMFRSGDGPRRSGWARGLVYLWIVQNIFLMASTIWRIWLYVEACLLTRLRVASLIWVMLVAMGFVWIIVKIRSGRSNAWLWAANTLTLCAVLAVCAGVNFSGLIADFNVTHCQEFAGPPVPGVPLKPPIEVAYLQHLGSPALPALLRLKAADHLAADQAAIDTAIAAVRGILEDELADWRGWTWRRARTRDEAQLDAPRSRRIATRYSER